MFIRACSMTHRLKFVVGSARDVEIVIISSFSLYAIFVVRDVWGMILTIVSRPQYKNRAPSMMSCFTGNNFRR